MTKTPEQIVRDVIQRVYGDATQTVLDRRAASEVVKALREAGWASLDEVGLLIMAAGGKVEVTANQMLATRPGHVEVFRSENYATGGHTFTARATS